MDHAGFILTAFGVTAVIVGGMIVAIMRDHRALKRALARIAPDQSRS